MANHRSPLPPSVTPFFHLATRKKAGTGVNLVKREGGRERVPLAFQLGSRRHGNGDRQTV